MVDVLPLRPRAMDVVDTVRLPGAGVVSVGEGVGVVVGVGSGVAAVDGVPVGAVVTTSALGAGSSSLPAQNRAATPVRMMTSAAAAAVTAALGRSRVASAGVAVRGSPLGVV